MRRILPAIALLVVTAACNKGTPPAEPPAQACTMDAKICPDGSAVGRSGPDCEFAPCPEPATDTPACTKEAKVCPDGSAVGRTGPNCEFAPCPGEAAPE